MPPPRLGTLAHEPKFSFAPPVKKDSGGYGVGAGSSFGLGGYGLMPSSTGVAATPLMALGVSAYWAAVTRLATDHAKLSKRVMRALPKGGAKPDRKHRLNELFRDPNPWQNEFQFWSYVTSWYYLRGNAYILVIRDDAGQPIALVPLSPGRCSPMLSPRGELFYACSHPVFRDGEAVTMHRDNVMHIRSVISLDGYTGLSPIAAMPDVFGLAIAAQQHAAVTFRQGTLLSGVIKHPGKLNKLARAFLRQEWQDAHAGVQNAFQTAVLDEGMVFDPLSMSNEDAQLLETRQFSVPDICRAVGVPPHKVYDLSRAHFANMEQGNLEYESDSIYPLCKQVTLECGRTLLFSDERDDTYIDTDFDELRKTDRKTRYETDEIGIRSGRFTQNEARISDGREPNVPDGDKYLTPLNMGTTGNSAGGQSSAKPDATINQDEKPEGAEAE